MTAPEKLFEKHWILATGKPLDDMTKYRMQYCIDAIKEAQKEAYNEAIKDAAMESTIRFVPFSDNIEVSEESILKLLKP